MWAAGRVVERAVWMEMVGRWRMWRRRGGATKMCSTFFGGFMDKIDHISLTRIRRSKNSSDLSSGTVPRTIADEFSNLRILVIEIRDYQPRRFSQKCYTFWWRHPIQGLSCPESLASQ